MMVWIKGEYGLMANFRQATGGITNFLLTPKNPQAGNPYSFRDDQRQDFLSLGNLSENDPRYQVEFVTGDIKPGHFAGVIITSA